MLLHSRKGLKLLDGDFPVLVGIASREDPAPSKGQPAALRYRRPDPTMKNKATELRWINGPWLGRRLRSLALWFPRWPAIRMNRDG